MSTRVTAINLTPLEWVGLVALGGYTVKKIINRKDTEQEHMSPGLDKATEHSYLELTLIFQITCLHQLNKSYSNN